jgi:hypothetical protein
LRPVVLLRRSLLAAGLTGLGAVGVLAYLRAPIGHSQQPRPEGPRTVTVSGGSQLSAALQNARGGDHIVLADGTYSGSLTLSASGTAEAPIVVRAANPHKAVITGQWDVTGDRVTLYQLKWQGGGRVKLIGASHFRFLRNISDGATFRPVQFSDGSNDAEIAYNSFLATGGDRIIDVRPSGNSNFPRRMWIHHNYFANQSAGDGAVVGLGNNRNDSEMSVQAICEYNLGENLNGQLIYCKSSDNIARFNTYRRTDNSYPSTISAAMVRSGRNNQLIANASINGAGVTLRGKNHKAIGNYKDDQVSPSRWSDHTANVGNVLQDDYQASGNSGLQPAGEDCEFIGNIGHLRMGGGSSSNWSYPAARNLIEAHSGQVIIEGDGRAVGTTDRRNQSPSVTVPPYVVLLRADVGPDLPDQAWGSSPSR